MNANGTRMAANEREWVVWECYGVKITEAGKGNAMLCSMAFPFPVSVIFTP